MFDWFKSFFAKTEVTNVVNVAGDVARVAADSAIDAQVERQVSKFRNKIKSTNLTLPDKNALLAILDGLEAAVKAAYGDRQ